MNAEMMAVEFVRLAINKTDYLVSHINDNDREPSWDGDVEVYRKAGNTHSKSDLILKVPVQVKGHIKRNLKKQTITHPVELSDLRNYLNEGGTTFLVVYVDEEGEKYQIYYNALLPFDLKRLVSKYGEQKTKNIELKVLPKKKDEVADVFLTAAMHMKKQRPAISCDPISMEDLVKQGRVPELEIEYTQVSSEPFDPLDYLLDHDTYIYAKLPYGLDLPIEHVSHVELAGATVGKPVSVNGHTFYSHYAIIHSKATVEWHFGKSTRLVTDRNSGVRRFTFCEAGTLSQRIIDVEFMLQAMKESRFEVGDRIYPLKAVKPEELEGFNVSRGEKRLRELKTVKAMLDKLGVTDELDFDRLTVQDEPLINMLVSAVLCGKSVKWTGSNEIFPDIKLANLTIKLCVLKDEKNEGYFRIFEYSNAPICFVMKDSAGQQMEISHHVFLKKNSMLSCCNIDYTTVVRQLKRYPVSNDYSCALVWLLLEMLCAYDESKDARKDILESALDLAEWMRSTDPYTPQDLLDLNYYQTIKRLRELNAREVQGLHSIIESNPTRKDVYVGAYLLLGDYASAQYHYSRMEEEERAVFDSYPISHFMLPNNI